jgi:hypothetical protein
MSTSDSHGVSQTTSTGDEGLPDWWPPFTGPTIPWRDDDDSRGAALSLGAEHDRLLDAYKSLGERHGGGYMALLRGTLPEYVKRGLFSERDAERLMAILDAFQLDDPKEATDTILRLHEEATADPDAKPAALAVSSIAAAGVSRARRDFELKSGGALHDIATAAADVGGAMLTVPMGPPGMIVAATGASILAGSVVTAIR